MLDKLKTLLDIKNDEKDDILNELIAISSNEFKDITHTNAIVEPIIIQMVIYKYNRVGTTGLSSESYTGIDLTYTDSYPEELKKQILSHRKIRVI